MATDATGTPTSLGIPTYNVDVDSPSGLGFNSAMGTIDGLIAARVKPSATPAVGDSLVWDGTNWVPTGAAVYGTRPSTVATSGATFATGTDVLLSPLDLDADGTSLYVVRISAARWASATTGSAATIRLNLDGADAGFLATTTDGNLTSLSAEVPITPAAGTHTVNARLVRDGGTGNAQINGGTGGAGADLPILITIKKL